MMWLGLLSHLADYTIPQPIGVLSKRSVWSELNLPIFFIGLIITVTELLRTTHAKPKVLVGSILTVLLTMYLLPYLGVCGYPILLLINLGLMGFLFVSGLTILIVEVLEKITENPTQPTQTRS